MADGTLDDITVNTYIAGETTKYLTITALENTLKTFFDENETLHDSEPVVDLPDTE